MRTDPYRFVTRWCFQAQIEEIAPILEDIESLSDWWPTVYLDAKGCEGGAKNGVGSQVDLISKGRLPYQLRLQITLVESNLPHHLRIECAGDLVGSGVWSLVQQGPLAEVQLDWSVRPEKAILRTFAWVLKPMVEWDHRWAMDQGELCLCAEIKRRRRDSTAREPILC